MASTTPAPTYLVETTFRGDPKTHQRIEAVDHREATLIYDGLFRRFSCDKVVALSFIIKLIETARGEEAVLLESAPESRAAVLEEAHLMLTARTIFESVQRASEEAGE